MNLVELKALSSAKSISRTLITHQLPHVKDSDIHRIDDNCFIIYSEKKDKSTRTTLVKISSINLDGVMITITGMLDKSCKQTGKKNAIHMDEYICSIKISAQLSLRFHL
uniref:Uncharacterized protein n=1 Tax=Onchocerca volvulus TaxID=6282 RepID=A0A8R1TPH6_ONCVO